MNKRERREQVMSQRYAKVDQRKQESEKAKAHQVKFDAMMVAMSKSNNLLAKQFIELDRAFRTNDHRQMDVLTKWHETNPEQAKEMVKFLEDFKAQHFGVEE